MLKPWSLAVVCAVILQTGANAQCTVAFTHCPSDTTILDCDNSGNEIMIHPLVTANPNGLCHGFNLVQTAGPINGSLVPLGTYLIAFQAQGLDANQQVIATANCSFLMSFVKDQQPPTLICPPNITVYGIDNGAGSCTAQAYWATPALQDACEPPMLSASSHPCGSAFPNGTTTVSYTATDPAGNPTSCSFTVTVICVSGGNELEKPGSAFNFYPNPTTGEVTLRVDGPGLKTGALQVLDLYGRAVQRETLPPGATLHTFSMAELPAGVYFVVVQEDGVPLSIKKLVKQ